MEYRLVYAKDLKAGDQIRTKDGEIGTVYEDVAVQKTMCPACKSDTVQKLRISFGEPGDRDDRHMLVDLDAAVELVVHAAPSDGPSPYDLSDRRHPANVTRLHRRIDEGGGPFKW